VPAEIDPPELARLVDYAERPRTSDWSLRAALVRYAQPQPQRVNDLLDVVRRTDFALADHNDELLRDGDALWDELADGADGSPLIELLRIAQELDGLGDVLAAWAVDRAEPSPDAEVDRVTADVAAKLDALGVPQQERPPGPRNRG
jgi:hypothetical protein